MTAYAHGPTVDTRSAAQRCAGRPGSATADRSARRAATGTARGRTTRRRAKPVRPGPVEPGRTASSEKAGTRRRRGPSPHCPVRRSRGNCPRGPILLARRTAPRPHPGKLVADVVEAAFDLTPRTVVDPWAAARPAANLTARVVRLQAGLFGRTFTAPLGGRSASL